MQKRIERMQRKVEGMNNLNVMLEVAIFHYGGDSGYDVNIGGDGDGNNHDEGDTPSKLR